MKKNSKLTIPSHHLEHLPGHLIRRLNQIAVGIFMTEVEPLGLTPIQFAALQGVHQQPKIDQKSLANVIGLDTSTTGGVIDRLELRGLLARQASEFDRRVRLLVLTAEGEQILQEAIPLMLSAQDKILSPLSDSDQIVFLKLLNKIITENNELSRVPTQSKD
jgi:DNA-binding MarR family transcriptional regulator